MACPAPCAAWQTLISCSVYDRALQQWPGLALWCQRRHHEAFIGIGIGVTMRQASPFDLDPFVTIKLRSTPYDFNFSPCFLLSSSPSSYSPSSCPAIRTQPASFHITHHLTSFRLQKKLMVTTTQRLSTTLKRPAALGPAGLVATKSRRGAKSLESHTLHPCLTRRNETH